DRRAVDRLGDAFVGRSVSEVARDVGEPLGEAAEDLLVELLARPDDRVARALDELVDRPVVDGDAEDRAVEQPALLEPVERPERHRLREIAGDAEDDEPVCVLAFDLGRTLGLRDAGGCASDHAVSFRSVEAGAGWRELVCSTETISTPSSSNRS